MIDHSRFRFVFVHQNSYFGLTQDEDLVREASKEGCANRQYERSPGVIEYEVNLGRREESATARTQDPQE